MTEEIWRPVVGYEGLYEVSSYGRVRSLRRGRILTSSINRDGYVRCHIKVNGVSKYYLVHRMVAEAFIPNPDNLPQVNHKDEDKTNNRVENLEMCNAKYNSNYGSRIERVRATKIKNGTYTGLSREEYFKKRYQEKKDKIRDYNHQYYLKKKAGL